ncbi:EamA family transporter [Sediminibacterium roseum]|uniref:EamA family transporter n=1 Tax=Sediminibacterium roseum TaxID=1978412 RepID=A0ABW9ZQK3_9BACT|nr:EamA family transporter [Sediminibacterium roseum]NCI48757.1 EamA family transporter [Sediminibacterium roseum]
MTTKQKAYIALALTSTVWGTTWVASKIGIQQVPALEIASIRQFIAGVLLVGFYLARGEKLPTGKQLLWLTMMGVLLFVSANGIATLSLKHIPSGMGALVSALYPLSVVIIERVFFKNTKITFITFAGLLLGIGGIAVVFYDNAFANHSEGYFAGVCLALIAMLSWSIGTIVLARSRNTINPYYAAGWEMLISSIIIIGMLSVSGDAIPLAKIPAQAWGALAYLIIASNIITFIAFIYTMKHLQPAKAALYAYINPIVAIFTGSLLLGENITWKIIVGSIITLVGVYLVNQSLRKQKELAAQQAADII